MSKHVCTEHRSAACLGKGWGWGWVLNGKVTLGISEDVYIDA